MLKTEGKSDIFNVFCLDFATATTALAHPGSEVWKAWPTAAESCPQTEFQSYHALLAQFQPGLMFSMSSDVHQATGLMPLPRLFEALLRAKRAKGNVRSELRIEVSVGFSANFPRSEALPDLPPCHISFSFWISRNIIPIWQRRESETGARVRKGEKTGWQMWGWWKKKSSREKERPRVDCRKGQKGSRVWRRGLRCWLIHAGDLCCQRKRSRAEYQCFLLCGADEATLYMFLTGSDRIWQIWLQ